MIHLVRNWFNVDDDRLNNLHTEIRISAFHFPDVAQLELSDVLNKNCGNTPYGEDRDRPLEGRLQESPWLVLFYFPEEQVNFCHGTLITTKHVLTTAVCASNIVPDE